MSYNLLLLLFFISKVFVLCPIRGSVPERYDNHFFLTKNLYHLNCFDLLFKGVVKSKR